MPGALHQGLAFSLLTGFMKTVALYVLIVGSVRGFRDLERLAFVYFAAASVFSLVVLTRGADSVCAFWRAGRYDVAVPRVRVADTVGAGDAFMAGLLSGLMSAGLLGGLRTGGG